MQIQRGAAALTLSGHLGDIIRWEQSSDNFATPAVGISNTDSTYAAQPPAQTTWYRVLVQNGSCPPAYSNRFKVERAPEISLEVYGVSGCNSAASLFAVADSGRAPYTYSISPQSQPDNTTGEFKYLPTGVYTVTVKDANGCQTSKQINLTNTAAPAAITQITNIAASSAMIKWTDVPPGISGGVRYNIRYREKGAASWINIVNQTTLFRYLVGLDAGATYEVQVQYICPGSATPSAWSASKEFATIAARENFARLNEGANSGWRLYPNPASEVFYIEGGENLGQTATLDMFNSSGHAVLRKRIPVNGTAKIVLPEDLPSGVYHLSIADPEGGRRLLRLICR